MEFLVLWFSPTASCHPHLYPTCYLYTLTRSPPEPSLWRLNNPSFLGHSTPDTSHQCRVEKKNHLPWPAGDALPHTAKDVVGCLTWKGRLLANGPLGHQDTPRHSSAKLLACWSAPSLYWCIGLVLPWYRTWHSLLVNLLTFLFAHFSSLSRSLWTAPQLSGVSSFPIHRDNTQICDSNGTPFHEQAFHQTNITFCSRHNLFFVYNWFVPALKNVFWNPYYN